MAFNLYNLFWYGVTFNFDLFVSKYKLIFYECAIYYWLHKVEFKTKQTIINSKYDDLVVHIYTYIYPTSQYYIIFPNII